MVVYQACMTYIRHTSLSSLGASIRLPRRRLMQLYYFVEISSNKPYINS
nr:MAG TPA: hypothetical protein [Caudoviricetes sp.]